MPNSINHKLPVTSKIPTVVSLFAWTMIFAGPAIFLHEFGHYMAGVAFGEDVRMTVSSVVSDTKASDYPPLQRVIQTGAGPLVSIILTLLGLIILKHRRNVGAALAIAAPARFVFSVGFLGVLLYRQFAGLPPPSPSFDEFTVMTAVGLPVWPLLLAELAFLIFVGIRVNKALPATKKWLCWLALLTGTVAGGFLWLNVVGALLF